MLSINSHIIILFGGIKIYSLLVNIAQCCNHFHFTIKMKQKGNNKKAFNPKKPVKAAENPFDKFANPRKKHEVLNRKVKGEDRNVGRARGKAVESRKKRLLDDYKASKKSNTFTDRRFGEDDPSMSLEEKNFLRLQKETQHSSKKYSSIFNLDEDNEVLTHGGSVLGASNIQDSSWVDEDAQDDNLNKDVVSSLHFGGGLVRKEGGDATSTEPKTRLEALQEVVMKSKLHKMEKKESKDHQEDERARLDREFEELLSGSVIKYRPSKGEAGYDPALDDVKEGGVGGKTDKVASDYDVALRTMAYEAKVQPADRTKCAEELAAEAREKLEEQEKARLSRMKGGPIKGVDAEEQGVIDAALEGEEDADTAGRRRKGLTDDEDAFYTEYAVEKSKKQLKKLAKEKAKRARQEDEEESGSEESGSESEDDWEEDEDAVGGSGSEEEGSDEEGSDEESEDEYDREYKARLSARINAPKSKSKAAATAIKTKATATAPVADESGVNDKMPHKIECPTTLEGFDELVERYVATTVDMNSLVERILVWNSVKLPGQQGASNRGPMHNFLDVLIRHFVRVGNALGSVSEHRGAGISGKNDHCSETVESILSQLDFLTKAIHQLTSDIDAVSVTLWRKTFKAQLVSVLAKKLRDYAIGVDVVSCFPSLGRLLLIKLMGQIFSVTDYSHALITPLVLFMCQCLTQCPVNTPLDVSSGLLMSSMLLDFTAETKRYIPEVTLFLRSVVSLFFTPAKAGFLHTARLSTFNTAAFGWLRQTLGASSASTADVKKLPWSFFGVVESCKFDVSCSPLDKNSLTLWSYGIYCTTLEQIAEIRRRYTDSVAFPEISCLLLEDMRVLRPQDSPVFPKSLLVKHTEELNLMTQARHKCIHGGAATPIAPTDESPLTPQRCPGRNPLQWRLAAKKAISTLVPRYDVNYSLQMKNPFDPNKEKAKAKTLTRQLKREQKAAMRELRRDADYVEQEKFAADTKKKDAARAERVKNYGMLEMEQGMINQQVRMGKASDIKGGGSTGVGLKRARISKY